MERNEFLEAAERLGVDSGTAEAAADRFEADPPVMLAVNGWIAAGKDTVAPLVLEELGVEGKHLYFSAPLKDDLTKVIQNVTESSTADEACRDIVERWGVNPAQAGVVTGALWLPTREESHGINGYTRIHLVRFLLQYWGTEVWRAIDQHHWARQTLKRAVEEIAQGRSVYLTDVRFESEALLARSIGFPLVKVEISREEQRRRLLARDGIEPDPALIYHEGEISLDDWDGFDLRVSNEGAPQETARRIAAHLRR